MHLKIDLNYIEQNLWDFKETGQIYRHYEKFVTQLKENDLGGPTEIPWVLGRQRVFSGWTQKSEAGALGGNSREPVIGCHVGGGLGTGNAPPLTTRETSFLPAATRDWAANNPSGPPGETLAPRLSFVWLLLPMDYLEVQHVDRLKLYVCARSALRFIFIYKWISGTCRKGHPFFTELHQHFCLSVYQHHVWIDFHCSVCLSLRKTQALVKVSHDL